MKAYALRRLLIMLPTFFGISLIVFVVLNIAPGRPGAQQSADSALDAESGASQESYRIFREQFNLDKPVLFNTRFTLTLEDIRRLVALAAGAMDEASTADRIAAQTELEDIGEYAVPHLMRLLDDADLRIVNVAVYFLRLNARRPLRDPFADDPSEATLVYNRAVHAENATLRTLRYEADAPAERRAAVLSAWRAWFETQRARFELSTGEKLRRFFLDTRFAKYWENLLQLDFGVSLVTREPVVATLVSKLRYSLSLSVGSLILAYLIAIPLGIFSAVKKDSTADRILTLGLFMLYSLPSFFVATLLLYFFSHGSDYTWLRSFPTGGWQSPDAKELTTLAQLEDVMWHLVLPLFCLTYGSLAGLSRYMRTGLLDVIRSDYVRTARAKGLSEATVIGKHALRNGLLPILTLLAGLLPSILGGSVIIEYIFGIPGMGLWMIEAIYARDYNVIMAVQLFSTVLVLLGLLLADLSYALVDPRIRYQ